MCDDPDVPGPGPAGFFFVPLLPVCLRVRQMLGQAVQTEPEPADRWTVTSSSPPHLLRHTYNDARNELISFSGKLEPAGKLCVFSQTRCSSDCFSLFRSNELFSEDRTDESELSQALCQLLTCSKPSS